MHARKKLLHVTFMAMLPSSSLVLPSNSFMLPSNSLVLPSNSLVLPSSSLMLESFSSARIANARELHSLREKCLRAMRANCLRATSNYSILLANLTRCEQSTCVQQLLASYVPATSISVTRELNS